jgi:uncharacterized cupredoxin-like copper-binding protein
MSEPLRRPLIAGLVLLILALVVSACAPNAGAIVPGTTTPSGSANASATAMSTATIESGAATSPLATPTTGESTSPLATPSGTGTSEPSLTASPEAGSTAGATAQAGGATSGGTPSATRTATTGGTSANNTPAAGTTATEGSGSTAANGINDVTYSAVEYSFQGPDQLPAGWTRLTLNNQGKASHDMQLYGIDAGKTLQDVTQALSAGGPPEWAHAYGSVTAAPGQKATYTVNLLPGNYVMLSFGNNQSGPPDAAQGMLKLITVTGATPAAGSVQLPTPDVTINMVDYSFQITGTVKSGAQNVLLTNSGTEIHEAQVVKLNEGTTFEQFQKLLMAASGSNESQMPATPAWGMTLSPGISAYSAVSLTPGNYAIVCFIPSAKNGGKPHYMLGMIQSLTVK